MWVSVLNKHFKQLFLVLVKSHEREINGNSFCSLRIAFFCISSQLCNGVKYQPKDKKVVESLEREAENHVLKYGVCFTEVTLCLIPCLPCIKCSFRRKKGNFLPGMVGRSFKEYKFGIAFSPPSPIFGKYLLLVYMLANLRAENSRLFQYIFGLDFPHSIAYLRMMFYSRAGICLPF